MPSCNGSIKSVGEGKKFTARFNICDFVYSFSGNLDTPQVFASTGAKLEYTDKRDLLSKRDFNAEIEGDSIKITLSNGPEMKGPLNSPVSPTRTSGFGSWAED
ncbi:hypothetical protein ABW20_dc0100128 [Dactylellina cionopaga]|nr:hypothetical protein ABW20_dc0100128 [Dactylellina cionopaga]